MSGPYQIENICKERDSYRAFTTIWGSYYRLLLTLELAPTGCYVKNKG